MTMLIIKDSDGSKFMQKMVMKQGKLSCAYLVGCGCVDQLGGWRMMGRRKGFWMVEGV